MYRKIWINGTANIWRDWQFLRGMRKLAYMRYFKAITTPMTVIFLASQPRSSLDFASWSKDSSKNSQMITLRTNVPWIPLLLWRLFFFLSAFSKTSQTHKSWQRQKRSGQRNQKFLGTYTTSTSVSPLELPLGFCKLLRVMVILRCEGWTWVAFIWVLLLSNQAPSSVPASEAESLS